MCELCISSEVIGQSPEGSSDHQEAEGQAEEDHDKDDVGSESADEEDEGQDTHEEQPESYSSLAKGHQLDSKIDSPRLALKPWVARPSAEDVASAGA